MLSIEQINKMEQDIEAYKQSEQEALEIIAELKHENENLKKELKRTKDTGEITFDVAKDLIYVIQDIKDIAKETIDKRPNSDNSIFEKIVSLIYERTGM